MKKIEELNNTQMEAIRNMMDDEKAEQTNRELAPCTNREFIERYIELDPDFENVLENEFSVEV